MGDKPSKRMKPGAAAFEGAACEKRLIEWILHLVPFDDLDLRGVKKYEIINQCDYAYADLYASFLLRNTIYIALGNNASKALRGISHFKLPHPSGRNRQINDKAFINQRLAECLKYIQSHK